MEKRGPDSDAETLAFFAEHLGRLSEVQLIFGPFCYLVC
jgi:hypothetical protein